MRVDLEFDPRIIVVVLTAAFLIQLAFALVAILVPADGPFVNFLYRRAAFDSERPEPVLIPVIDDWGDELQLLRR